MMRSHGLDSRTYDEVLLLFTPDCSEASAAAGAPMNVELYVAMLDHFTCLVDLLDRSFRVTAVTELQNKAPFNDALYVRFGESVDTLVRTGTCLERRERCYSLVRFGSADACTSSRARTARRARSRTA